MLVESEMLYTAFLIVYIVTFVLNLPIVFMFLQAISPVSVSLVICLIFL